MRKDFRTIQREKDKERFTTFSVPKSKPVIPDYFAHLNNLQQIKSIDLLKQSKLLSACSKNRNKLEGMYLSLIIAQNEEITKADSYNKAQRDALIEQSSRFMANRKVLLVGMNADIAGKIKLYEKYEAAIEDQRSYDLILVGNVVDVYKNFPGLVFQRALEKDMRKEDSNSYETKKDALQKLETSLEEKSVTEKLDEKLEELFLAAARDRFDYFYPHIIGEKHQKLVDERKGLLPWRLMLAESPADYLKAELEIECHNNFPDMFGHLFPEVIEQIEKGDPLGFLYDRLTQAGVLIFSTNPDYRKPGEDTQLINTGELFNLIGERRIGRENYIALTPRFKNPEIRVD